MPRPAATVRSRADDQQRQGMTQLPAQPGKQASGVVDPDQVARGKALVDPEPGETQAKQQPSQPGQFAETLYETVAANLTYWIPLRHRFFWQRAEANATGLYPPMPDSVQSVYGHLTDYIEFMVMSNIGLLDQSAAASGRDPFQPLNTQERYTIFEFLSKVNAASPLAGNLSTSKLIKQYHGWTPDTGGGAADDKSVPPSSIPADFMSRLITMSAISFAATITDHMTGAKTFKNVSDFSIYMSQEQVSWLGHAAAYLTEHIGGLSRYGAPITSWPEPPVYGRDHFPDSEIPGASDQPETQPQVEDFQILSQEDQRKVFEEGMLRQKPTIIGRDGTPQPAYLRRTRNRTVVKYAKELNAEKYGALTCEYCKVQPANQQSQTEGRPFFPGMTEDHATSMIQAHHIIPMKERSGVYEISAKDLLCLCKNCHDVWHINGNASRVESKKQAG